MPSVSLSRRTASGPSSLTSSPSFGRQRRSTNNPLFAIQQPNDENFKSGEDEIINSFNPLNLSNDDWTRYDSKEELNQIMKLNPSSITLVPLATTTAIAIALSSTTMIDSANAAANAGSPFSSGDFNPDNFRPVCPASDSIYRFAQGTTQSLVGQENFIEYGPLIAGGLLRVRLELCVVESFFNEAVGPFIDKEGLGWILPFHETVETFLAGTIFALASTFILVGSTKIVSVIVTYADVFIGGPLRLFGGFAFDRAKGKPVTLDVGFGPFKKRIIGPGSPKEDQKKEETLEEIFNFSEVQGKDLPVALFSGALKGVGESSKLLREVLEGLDLFVGRYLTLIATGYIGIKFIHFKVFPDFPPF